MMRKLSLLALFSMVAGCMAEPGGSIQLVHVMAPDQQCKYKEEGKDIKMSGEFDPTLGDQMAVVLRIRNNMNDQETDTRLNDNNANIKPRGNDMSLAGYNVCYRVEKELTEAGAGDSGRVLDCGDIINATPGQYKEFIPAGGTVPADPQGQSEGMPTNTYLFSETALQGLFGEAFLVDRIVNFPSSSSLSANCADVGVGADGRANSACTEDVTSSVVSLNLTNNVAQLGISDVDGWPWGDWSLEDIPNQKVLVAMQAVGKTMSGATVESNWLNFSVELCPGCREINAVAEIVPVPTPICLPRHLGNLCRNRRQR